MGIMLIAVGTILAIMLLVPKKLQGIAKPTASAPTPTSIDLIVLENAKRYTVDPALIRAFIQVESSGNPNAINPLSGTNKAVSYGLMQITPALAEDYGIVRDYHNATEAEIAMIMVPSTNVRIGTWFISKLLNQYAFDEAVQMYNVGITGYKNGARASDYLAKIKRYYNEYKSD